MSKYADSLPVRLVFNDDGGLELTAMLNNRLRWNTDTDWNKGTLGTDVEVVGSGTAAKIAPTESTGFGNDIYLCWHLNESSGTTAADSGVHNRPGTLVTVEGYNPAQWVSGKLNNALSNPGEYEAADYISGGDIAAFDWDDSFSIECWFNKTAGYDISFAGNYSSGDGKGWMISTQEGYLRVLLHGGGETYIQTYSTTTILDATWQHLVMTYDGTGLAAGIKLYIDGVLLEMSPYYDGLAETSIVPASNTLKVGAISDATYGFIGSIDEFNLYSVELSQENVTTRYNAGDGTEVPVFTQPVYPSSATYTTNIYDCGTAAQDWDTFNYTPTIPTDTTVTVKVRASDDYTNMGLYSSALTPGQALTVTGQFIQFSVEFTGTLTARALVDSISVLFTSPELTEVTP